MDNWMKCKEKRDDCIQKHRFLPVVIICQKEQKLFFDFEMFNFMLTYASWQQRCEQCHWAFPSVELMLEMLWRCISLREDNVMRLFNISV